MKDGPVYLMVKEILKEALSSSMAATEMPPGHFTQFATLSSKKYNTVPDFLFGSSCCHGEVAR